MFGLSRRTLLKGGLAGLSSIVLGPGSFWQRFCCEAAEARTYVSLQTGKVIQGIPTTCGLCRAGCGMLAFLDEGRLVGLAGNPDHPYNRGALCAFGSAAMLGIGGPCRIRRPLRRLGKRGEGRWKELSWQEARQTLAEVLGGLRGADQEKPLALCVPGRAVTPLVHRFLSFFGNTVLALADGHEQWTEVAVHRSFHERFEGEADLAKADRILNFGANPLGSIRSLVGTARQWAEGEHRGARWITVDPRLSETAAASHAWIPLRPGTDGVLALALAHHIVNKGWENRSFLQSATDVDVGTLRELLAPWTPEKAGVLCDVPADRIRSIAREFATGERPVTLFGSGVTAREGGLESAQAILLLNFLVGNIGRSGGYRRPGRMEWRQPDPLPSGDRDVPVLRGTLFWDLQRGKRRIGCLLSHGANPAVSDPDASETAETLLDEDRVPFHIALASRWDESAERADLVLPGSTFLESWGLLESSSGTGSSGCVSLRQPVCRTEGPTLSLDELLLEIARSLAGDEQRGMAFEDVEDYYRRLFDSSLSPGACAEGFEDARKRGFVRVPAITGGAEGMKYGVQSVLSESVQSIAVRMREGGWDPASSGEKTLILYASPTRGDLLRPCEWVDEIDHADPVWVHPKAAEELGCVDGDWVTLKGPAGIVETRVRLTEGIHPDCVAVAASAEDGRHGTSCPEGADTGAESDGHEHWWTEESYGGNIRRVVPWPQDPHRESPGWMDTRVTLTRLEKKTEHRQDRRRT